MPECGYVSALRFIAGRTEYRLPIVLCTRKQDFRGPLVNSLLENGIPATSDGMKQNRCTVSGPTSRPVVPFLQRQAPWVKLFGPCDSSSRKPCHASLVCPYTSPQELSFISVRKCWKCSVIGIIFAIGCRSPFQERLLLVRQSQLTPSRFLHNRIYVTGSALGRGSFGSSGDLEPHRFFWNASLFLFLACLTVFAVGGTPPCFSQSIQK